MKLTNIMLDLEGSTASLGLFGEPGEDGHLTPPHVQISVHVGEADTRTELRQASITAALAALNHARVALEEAKG